MRIFKLFFLAKGFLVLFIIASSLTILHQFTYSNVPLFTQYLFKVLLEQPGIGDPNVVIQQVNLPAFLIRFFEQGPTIMNVVIRIAVSLITLQVFRFSMRFIEMWSKGYLHERMGEKMRTKLYSHIQNLDYAYHNNADTGDLIQRVTSDVETTTNFFNRTIDIIHLSATLFFGAYQLID
jgi:ATP-binding cassette, subfamily B, bacterial